MQANDNKTILYRIRRKSDGQYLICAPCKTPGPCYFFGPKGCFWQTQDTIIKHLRELCTFRAYIFDQNSSAYYIRPVSDIKSEKIRASYGDGMISCPAFFDTKQGVARYVYEWMDLYEVVATPVTLHSSESVIIDAQVFGIEEKEQVNVS